MTINDLLRFGIVALSLALIVKTAVVVYRKRRFWSYIFPAIIALQLIIFSALVQFYGIDAKALNALAQIIWIETILFLLVV